MSEQVDHQLHELNRLRGQVVKAAQAFRDSEGEKAVGMAAVYAWCDLVEALAKYEAADRRAQREAG